MKYAAKLKFIADESFDEGRTSTGSCARTRSPRTSETNDRTRAARGPMPATNAAPSRSPSTSASAQGRLRRGPRNLADLRQQFRARRLRREHRLATSPIPATAPSSCSTATSSRACRATSGSTNRQVLEIGGTYYRPQFRGTGFNRRVKEMMLAARVRLRHPPRRVPRRHPQRSLPGRDEEARRRARRRAARRPHHLDRPRPRHGAVRDPEGRMAGLASWSDARSGTRRARTGPASAGVTKNSRWPSSISTMRR